MDGDVSLHRDGHGHEDGRGHHDGLARVEEVREEEQVRPAEHVEAFPEALQDGPEQVSGVEERQSDQHLGKKRSG